MIVELKLDKRIKDFSDVQTLLKHDDKFIGETGYFADHFTQLQDLKKCRHETLSEINNTMGDEIFRSIYAVERGEKGRRFFVPESLLIPVEKKYRAFTNEEFVKLFDLGKFHSIRPKDYSTKRLERLIITDIYIKGGSLYVRLNGGDTGYSPAYFLDDYEYFDGKKWMPFGIEIKE